MKRSNKELVTLVSKYEEQIKIMSDEIDKQDDAYLNASYTLVELYNEKIS